jgi:hypothetical protein
MAAPASSLRFEIYTSDRPRRFNDRTNFLGCCEISGLCAMIGRMSDEPKPGVIGSLPRTRPHRRSAKRAAPAGAPPVDTQAQEPAVVKAAALPKAKAAKPPRAAKPPAAAKPRAPRATPAASKPRAAKATPAPPKAAVSTPTPPAPPEPAPGLLQTAVQAAAELAEIGLHAGARALRGAVSRLPRP